MAQIVAMDVAVGVGDAGQRSKGAVQINQSVAHGENIEKSVWGGLDASRDQSDNRMNSGLIHVTLTYIIIYTGLMSVSFYFQFRICR